MQKLYNKNQIVSIEIIDKELDLDYEYFEEKRGFLGIGNRESGIYKVHNYYNGTSEPIYKVNILPQNHFKQGNSFYHKPRIIITYSNNEEEVIYFNTIEERDAYIIKEFREFRENASRKPR